jgi:hypothetical protein
MVRFMRWFLVMAAALSAPADSAWAGSIPSITFSDTASTLPDTITVTATGFTEFTLNGVSGSTFTIPESASMLTFSGKWVNPNVTPTTGPDVLNLLESGGLVGPNGRELISDILSFQVSRILSETVVAQIQGTFQSDGPSGPGYIRERGPNETGVVENGLPVTVAYPGAPAPSQINLIVASDLNAPDTPEPASMTLMAIGIAGLAACGWRRRRKAEAVTY